MTLFYVIDRFGFAGKIMYLDDQYKQLAKGKICCMLRYQALYRSLGREDRKLKQKDTNWVNF